MPSQAKISHFSKKCPRQRNVLVPVAQLEEGHHNGKLFGAACLLRMRGPYFDQARAWTTHL